MRKLILAIGLTALAVTPTATDAQTAGGRRATPPTRAGVTHLPARPGGWVAPRPGVPWQGSRWGGRVNGRWYAGVYAPGGWGGYRRPVVGWILPTYWYSPNFYITDWSAYGLRAPRAGYNWSRYYDDAVLIDGRGRVYDSVSGIDWDRTGPAETQVYVNGAPVDTQPVVADRGPPPPAPLAPPPPPPPPPPARRDDGAGGAAIGAVAGGVAGNVIAGRGNRLGGTLLGAGAGALAGMAIDRAEDRGRRAPPRVARDYPPVAPDRGAPYPVPGDDRGYGPPPPPPVGYAPPVDGVSAGGYRHGHAAPGYPVPPPPYGTAPGQPYTVVHRSPGSVTTITVIPGTTTTTEHSEYYYERAPVRRKIAYRHARPSKLVKRCAC